MLKLSACLTVCTTHLNSPQHPGHRANKGNCLSLLASPAGSWHIASAVYVPCLPCHLFGLTHLCKATHSSHAPAASGNFHSCVIGYGVLKHHCTGSGVSYLSWQQLALNVSLEKIRTCSAIFIFFSGLRQSRERNRKELIECSNCLRSLYKLGIVVFKKEQHYERCEKEMS